MRSAKSDHEPTQIRRAVFVEVCGWTWNRILGALALAPLLPPTPTRPFPPLKLPPQDFRYRGRRGASHGLPAARRRSQTAGMPAQHLEEMAMNVGRLPVNPGR